MSINAFFFAEGQQLEEERGGGQAVNETVGQTRRRSTNEVVHIIWCCQVFACVSGWSCTLQEEKTQQQVEL